MLAASSNVNPLCSCSLYVENGILGIVVADREFKQSGSVHGMAAELNDFSNVYGS
jgi:hypothetical protein